MSTPARPFHLHGRSQLDALGACVQRVLPELARDWWSEENRIQLVGVTGWTDELRSSSLRCVVREGVDGWIAFVGAEYAWLKLAESWLHCEVPTDGPLIQALQREFCLAVYRRLAGRDAPAVVLEDGDWSRVPADALQPGAGTVVVELDVDGVPLTLVASIALWPELAAWREPRPAQPTHQVVSALGEIPVSVDVRLPCIRIPMTDMATLGVGDFLDLGYDLSGRVRVVGANVDVDLVAVLGQHDSHKAIRIETLQ